MEKTVKEDYWTEVSTIARGYGKIYYRHYDCEINPTELFVSPYFYCPCCGTKMKEKD